MACECKEWVQTQTDFESVDWLGNPITLHNVPAESCPNCNNIRIFADDVLKSEQKYLAEQYGLDPRHLPMLLLLHGSPKFIKPGYMEQKYRFHKMLFYFWKRLSKAGWSNSYIHDAFGSARAGPVSLNINELTKELETKGLVKVKWANKPGESFRWDLTDSGKDIAKKVWNTTPDDIKVVLLQVKKELFLLDAGQLKEKVHKEHPEYKRTYIDAEPDESVEYEKECLEA